MMGISRSAVLVASYLMIFQNMSILEALTAIRKKRPINPNEGFIKQLRDLNETLMEERDDDDDTLSQCSVIDAKTRAQIFGERYEEGEEEGEGLEEDGQSMAEAKAHSIMMDEEEDGASVMSSVPSLASSAAAEALRNGLIPRPGGEGEKEKLVLPRDGGEDDDFDDDEGLDSIIREWQRRNEKYQNDDWWEAQLNSDDEDGAVEKAVSKKSKSVDLESVTSEDVRSLKEKLKRRMRQKDEMSVASSCTTYSDLWKQRLKEIEEQAAARYRKKEDKSEKSKKEEGARKQIDEEVESLMSDTTSMYNFCQKNKESMSPLERWRVKRIQFGWNKKDREDGESSTVANGEEGDEEAPKKRLEDVNLTAYQSWKLRQQKRLGFEENNDDILEFSRSEESTKAAKRRQRREEILERSKKNLEESQSMCGWETESCVSGGTIPLSAFWAGVTAPPSAQNNDDNVSMISGRSSNISSVSQARSVKSVQSSAPPVMPPVLPVPTVQGPSGEPMVNLASIQNWITNVVTETIKQKTTEMSLPPSRAGSEVSYGGGGAAAASALFGQRMEFDKASTLSGASYLGANRAKAESVVSGASGASRLTGHGSVLGSTLGSSYESSLGTKKKKITTTSVPLFSLFQDEVDLKKLDAIDKDIKSEMREKMDKYEKKKILEDNRRSTLYKKKKPKEDEEDEDEEEERKRKEEEFLQEAKKKDKPARSFGLSGCLNLNPALEKEKNTSIDDWLKSVRPPPKKTQEELDELYDDLDASASEFGYEDERDSYEPRYRPRFEEAPTRSGAEAGEQRRGREAAREEEEDDISSFIAQTRQRIRARAMVEAENDEVLEAWRKQMEAKGQRTGGGED